jgi:hypothetical protein
VLSSEDLLGVCMQAKSSIMLRVLLSRYHQGAPEAFLGALPKEDVKEVISQEVISQDPAQAILHSKEVIQKIHYSWLVPVVKEFSPKMQPLIVHALPKGTSLSLTNSLKFPPTVQPLPVPIRLYLINILCEHLKVNSVLPPAFLPQTSLSPLINFKKRQLVELIDFLGLYDLADEIRHIVDKKYLKAIYKCLSIKKQHFLRICLHQKEKLSTSRIGLDRWNGDCQQMEKLLHRRGVIRLGYALSGQHPDFFWHIMHRLDTGRGNILAKYYTKEDIPGVTSALTQQVLSLMNFFKKMSEA